MKMAAGALLGVLLLSSAALPYWGGLEAEKHYRALHQRLRSESLGSLDVHESFERGWLHSTAETQVSTGAGGWITLRHTIKHGPLPLAELLDGRRPRDWIVSSVETEYSPTPESLPWLAQALAGEALVQVQTTLHADGHSTSELRSPALRNEALGLVWHGATGRVHIPRTLESASGSIESAGLELKREGRTIRVGSLAAQFDATLSAQGLPLGDASISLGSLEVSASRRGSVLLSARNWLLTQSSREDEEHVLQMRLTLRLEDFTRQNERFGPAEVALVLNNIDAVALQRLRGRHRVASEARLAPEQRRIVMAAAIIESLPLLLARSPGLELTRLRIQSPSGELSAAAKLSFDGDQIAALLDPSLLQQALNASAEFRVPAQMVDYGMDAYLETLLPVPELGNASAVPERALRRLRLTQVRKQLLQRLTAAKVFTREGYFFAARLEYRDGQVLLNGQAVDRDSLSSLAQPAVLQATTDPL